MLSPPCQNMGGYIPPRIYALASYTQSMVVKSWKVHLAHFLKKVDNGYSPFQLQVLDILRVLADRQ